MWLSQTYIERSISCIGLFSTQTELHKCTVNGSFGMNQFTEGAVLLTTELGRIVFFSKLGY